MDINTYGYNGTLEGNVTGFENLAPREALHQSFQTLMALGLISNVRSRYIYRPYTHATRPAHLPRRSESRPQEVCRY